MFAKYFYGIVIHRFTRKINWKSMRGRSELLQELDASIRPTTTRIQGLSFGTAAGGDLERSLRQCEDYHGRTDGCLT